MIIHGADGLSIESNHDKGTKVRKERQTIVELQRLKHQKDLWGSFIWKKR